MSEDSTKISSFLDAHLSNLYDDRWLSEHDLEERLGFENDTPNSNNSISDHHIVVRFPISSRLGIRWHKAHLKSGYLTVDHVMGEELEEDEKTTTDPKTGEEVPTPNEVGHLCKWNKKRNNDNSNDSIISAGFRVKYGDRLVEIDGKRKLEDMKKMLMKIKKMSEESQESSSEVSNTSTMVLVFWRAQKIIKDEVLREYSTTGSATSQIPLVPSQRTNPLFIMRYIEGILKKTNDSKDPNSILLATCILLAYWNRLTNTKSDPVTSVIDAFLKTYGSESAKTNNDNSEQPESDTEEVEDHDHSVTLNLRSSVGPSELSFVDNWIGTVIKNRSIIEEALRNDNMPVLSNSESSDSSNDNTLTPQKGAAQETSTTSSTPAEKPVASESNTNTPPKPIVVTSTAIYSCRSCRRPLFRDTPENIRPKCCLSSLFIRQPIAWMKEQIDISSTKSQDDFDINFSDPNTQQGRIVCPNEKCKSKLGHWTWIGMRCGCGGREVKGTGLAGDEWISPAFQFHTTKIDRVECNMGW